MSNRVAVGEAPQLGPAFHWRRDGELTWIETRIGGSRAAFSTRLGGVSEGAYSSLNLGILTDDDQARVAHNRELLAETLGREPAAVAMGLQVHGAQVSVHTHPPAPSLFAQRMSAPAEADAQLTNHPRVSPLVLVADCLPLALAAPGATGMVHCGWRGVAGGIVAGAVARLSEISGTEPAAVSAAIGPGIGACCYEVGEDVSAAFRARAPGALTGGRLDLATAIALELEHAGVDAGTVATVDLCTSCHPRLFFSHRRDGGVTGRQCGLAWLET